MERQKGHMTLLILVLASIHESFRLPADPPAASTQVPGSLPISTGQTLKARAASQGRHR